MLQIELFVRSLLVRNDVNQDGRVTPIDALRVINELNSPNASDAISGKLFASARPLSSLDVNDDVYITPIDALLVINELNSQNLDRMSAGDSPSSIDFVFRLGSTDDDEK